MDLDFVSVHKHAKKDLGQYPAILTSHLVNNPYLLPNLFSFMFMDRVKVQGTELSYKQSGLLYVVGQKEIRVKIEFLYLVPRIHE